MSEIEHGPGFLTGRVGQHSYNFEPPDVFHVHYVGQVEVLHFIEFNVAIKQHTKDRKVYVLRDARQGGYVTSETRAYAAKVAQFEYVAALVTYGASFQNQTVIAMMVKAANSLKRDSFANVEFRTEEEARAWIDEHRRLMLESPEPTAS